MMTQAPSRRAIPAAFAAAVLLASGSLPTRAADTAQFDTEKVGITVETIASGLVNPWAVEVLPDGAYIVTERPGRLRIIRNGQVSEPVEGLPAVANAGQGGLLDVALSLDFARDRLVYLTAALSYDGGAGTAVLRARLSDDERRLEGLETIFRTAKAGRTKRHFGARMVFARDGSLFIGLGERGEADRAQDPFDHAGSIIHIQGDGSIPTDNPYRDGARALPEIWSKGHRNPQGIAIDPADGTLLTVEHAAMGGDEINAPKPARNYGWPVITYGRDYDGSKIGVGTEAPGYEPPLHYWDPSIAPGALLVYQGAMFAEWRGDILVTSLKFGLISRLDRDASGIIGAEERMLDADFGRLRDIKEDRDGALLVTTDEDDGALLRISRASAAPTP